MTTVSISARLPSEEHRFAVEEAERLGISLTRYLVKLLEAERKQRRQNGAIWRPRSIGLAGALEIGGSGTNSAARAALARRRENR